ncbi:MAG: RagB/SusD family nutrient uptake outer membrane protein [Bacteroidales bacterium]|nr:RagB/SusD family nutrient uptake outer membrane protein [Bacteroidales bacterium]
MKLYNKIFVLATSALALTACVDLNTAPQGSLITTEQKKEVLNADPAKISAGVAGIASMFNQYMGGLGTGNGYHSDFGFGSIMLDTDCRGIDMLSPNVGYNWFSDACDLSDHVYSYGTTLMFWNDLYQQIYSANLVVAGIDPATEEPLSKFYLAQGLAMRAFDYFVLAQLYQFTYKGHENLPCVPLILDTNAQQCAEEGAARSSVQEVYDQIITDLDSAVELLADNPTVRDDKRYVDLATVYGIRARVNLVMQNWGDAASDAQAAIAASSATPLSQKEATGPGFNSSSLHNWMWAIVIAETDRVVTSGIVNWISHMGSFNYGYASVGGWKSCSIPLYSSINATDVRRTWWLDDSKSNKALSKEQMAFLTGMYKLREIPHLQTKFNSYNGVLNQSTNANDIPLMRIEEMYLIDAEATAMAGNPALGASKLEEFVKTYRDGKYACRASSAADVQEQVWLQRRIELWGEGLSYFDILRLEKGIDRRGIGYADIAPEWIFNVAPDDPYMIYCLPKSEIEGNPKLTDADNNAPGEAPKPVQE